MILTEQRIYQRTARHVIPSEVEGSALTAPAVERASPQRRARRL